MALLAVGVDIMLKHVNARFRPKLSRSHIDDCWATENFYK